MVAIGSICRSLPFIPESFWHLSTTAKLSRLSVIGFAAYGVGRWASLRSQRVTDLEGRLAQLEQDVWEVQEKFVAEESPEQYARLESPAFAKQLEVLKSAFSKKSLGPLLQKQKQREKLEQAVLGVFEVLTDKLCPNTGAGWRKKDTPKDKLKRLSTALKKLDSSLARNASKFDDKVYRQIANVVESVLTKLMPAVFAMSEKGSTIGHTQFERIFDRVQTSLPKMVASPSSTPGGITKALKRSAAHGVRPFASTSPVASAAAIKHNIGKKLAALKTNIKGNESADALIDIGTVVVETLIDLALENEGTPAGKLLWPELQKIVAGTDQMQASLQHILEIQCRRLRKDEGQAEAPAKIIQACQDWYRHIFQLTEKSVSVSELIDSLKVRLEQALSQTKPS